MKRNLKLLYIILSSALSLCAQSNETSRTSIYLDSLNVHGWGANENYIENLDRLSEIAFSEDSFRIYELCRTSVNIVYRELKDYTGLISSINLSEEYEEGDVASQSFKVSILNERAILSRFTGDFRDVVDIRLDAIEIAMGIEEHEIELATMYGNIVVDYFSLGDLVKSKEYCDKGLELIEELDGFHYERAFFYHGIAKIFLRKKMYNEAVNFFNKADASLFLERDKVEGVKRLEIDNCLLKAETKIRLSQFIDARELLSSVVELQKHTDFRIYRLYEVKSIYHLALKEYSEGYRNIQKSIESLENKDILDSEYSVLSRMYMNLSFYYLEINELINSLNALEQGLLYFRTEEDSINYDYGYSELAIDMLIMKNSLCARIYIENKLESDYEQMVKNFKETTNVIANIRKKIIQKESKFEILEKSIPFYDTFLNAVFEHYKGTYFDLDKNLIFDAVNQTKSAILSDKVNYKNLINDPNLPPLLIRKEKDLRLKRALYKKQVKKIESQDSIDVDQLAAFKDSLFRFNQDYDILDKRIREAKEEVTGWNLNDDIDLDQLSQLMKQDEMMIDYYVSDEYIYYVAIWNGETFVDRVLLESVKDDIINFVDYISQPPTANNQLNVVALSDNIFSSLLEPYIENRSSVKSLRILPSGLLNALPFEALSYEEEGITKYLVEDCPILYSVSRSQLLQKEELSSSHNIMALAPKFESDIISDTRYACDGAELSNLKYAQEEVGYIQNAYAVTNNDSISASYFLENISNNDICHLATHGCVNASDPMLSEIFFNDQPVTGYDVMNLDTDLSLMFLSACNTARGEDVQGEGVIGLTSGFFEAGVRNMISSLWSIDDLASSQIVKGFYKNVKEGDTYSQALRASKLEYLESADKLRSHPYYWAGLVQIGAGVTIEKSQPWWLYLGGFGLLGIGYLFWRKKQLST